jgi:hypothetical protein
MDKAMCLSRSAVFLINLVQDVNVLRPLLFMSARDFRFETTMLVSTKFIARDLQGVWLNELEQLRSETGAKIEFFDSDWEAHRHLNGRGLIFAASESHLPNHATTHNVFRHAPPGYLRVTLQHGFECVGFRHSAEHVRAHGQTVSFAADVVCAWSNADQLTSLAPSQRNKLLVTGPTSVLQMPTGHFDRTSGAPGLVCENLHSVRFQDSTHTRDQFLETFSEFANLIAKQKRRVSLRPHVGGQYSLKGMLALPSNVDVENAPLYRLDLRRFAYGISPPSSVLIDMLLAGIPTAVWRDTNDCIDVGNFEGLTVISSPAEWVQFARQAEEDPERFLNRQRRFLERQQMPLEPKDVFRRFAGLFQAAERMEVRAPGSVAERERILFVASGHLPTLQLSFEKPLAPLVARGEIATRLLTEQQIRRQTGISEDSPRARAWIEEQLDSYNPSAIVFCRYSGPAYETILGWAKREQVPAIYHIDDDLLAIPRDIGERKFAYHNAPERLSAVTELLKSADLVYASGERLKSRLVSRFPDLHVVAGDIYCASTILRRPNQNAFCKIGYMASADHAHNLEMIMPAIEQLLDCNPGVCFELFGSISLPEGLKRFGNRTTTMPAIADYDDFLHHLAEQEWDVGICPLSPIEFNLVKANTKWVEYTATGAAVVASRGTVYDECCANGCGLLAASVDDWFSALDFLVNDVEERLAIVQRAQAKLGQQYNISTLREQVLRVMALGHEAVRARREAARSMRV